MTKQAERGRGVLDDLADDAFAVIAAGVLAELARRDLPVIEAALSRLDAEQLGRLRGHVDALLAASRAG